MHFSIRNARNKRLVVSLLLIASLAAILLPLSANDERALVRSLVGSANVIRGGKTEALRVGSIIKDSDRIQTGRQSQIIVLYKGVEIRLRGETDATLVSLTNTKEAASLKLDKGFGWFRVDDPTKRGFKVQTPTSIAAVRGTKFAVGYDENGSTSCVCEGKVATNAAGAVNETPVSVGGSHDYGKNGKFAEHNYSKYFKKLKVDRSFQQEILRDAKLNNCKSCHQMTNIATDTSPDPQIY